MTSSSNPFQARIYTTGSRKELMNLTRDFAKSIKPEFLTSKDKPFIIAINGDMNCGKSLIWDEFRFAVMGRLDNPLEEKISGGDIVFKKWVAPHLETQDEIRLLTENANMSGRTRNKADDAVLLKTSQEDSSIILFSNLDPKLTSQADILITLNVIGAPFHTNWERTICIETNNQALLNSARYQRELSIFG